MDSMLLFQKLLSEGEITIPEPEKVSLVVFNHDHVLYLDELRVFVDYACFKNEYLGEDQYQYDISGRQSFTLDDFEEWKLNNPTALEDYYSSIQEDVSALAIISNQIEYLISEGTEISRKAGIPFQLTIKGETFNVEKLVCVDWDSSSMYC